MKYEEKLLSPMLGMASSISMDDDGQHTMRQSSGWCNASCSFLYNELVRAGFSERSDFPHAIIWIYPGIQNKLFMNADTYV